ncbi:hypothetical protein FJZ36_08130 [Candidatus Poribacteria bacterium]|nr:hypothetical protein [Candidatus Poribacteria bacterium]
MLSLIHRMLAGSQELLKGGPMLIPLAFFSLVATTVVLERWKTLRRDRYIPSEYVARIYRQLERGKYDLALALCESRSYLVTDLLKLGIENRHASEEALTKLVRLFFKRRLPELYRNMHVLALVATLAPLLGLLGTVLGMVTGFKALAVETGQMQLRIVADGISVALLTTFAGLLIAVPTLVAHQILMHRADRLAMEARRYGIALIRFLKMGELVTVDEDESELEVTIQDTDVRRARQAGEAAP